MHVATRWINVRRVTRNRLMLGGFGAILLCILVGAMPAVAAPTGRGDVADLQAIADLEQRAVAANPREQAFLYADLADRMTLLAGRQIADGEIEKAAATLKKLEDCTARMESNFQQSKSLKKTELLLHMTNRRLTDMARAASADMKPQVQSALARLNVAQASLLVAIFAK